MGMLEHLCSGNFLLYMSIEQDKHTIRKMVELYVHHKLHLQQIPADYEELISYACARLSHCRYGEDKPACKNCPTHCYKPEMRQRIRVVMRWSGLRIVFLSPLAALRHLLNK